MNIEKEIKHLLLKHECIIVPGFGAFITHYEGAQIYPGQHQFFPPSKTVSFNRLLSNNDGILYSAIAQSNEVTYAEASLAVEKQVYTWNNALEKQESILIRDIGKIQKSKDDKIDFISNLTENLSLASYGLPMMYHHPIDRIFTRASDDKGIGSSTSTVIKKQKDNRKKGTRKNRSATYVLAACLFAIIALSQLMLFTEAPIRVKEANFINFWPTSEVVQHDIKAAISNMHTGVSIVNESISIRNANQKCKAIAPIIVETSKVIAPVVTVPKNANDKLLQNEAKPSGYYLILGCFKEAKNAERLKDELTSQGKKVYQKTSNTGYTTIGEFVSSSKEEANAILKKRQQSQADVWLKKI